jgi:chromosome segregation ATPase
VKFTIITICCLMAISGVPQLYGQQIYTWIDENGITHITDQAPPKKARVEDVIKYKEKTAQEQDAIERKIEKVRKSNERQDKIDAAQRAAVESRETEKRAREAVANARQETLENQEYVRKLSNRRWKRKKFKKRIERLKIEAEATQAEAEAEVQQAEEAAKKAREAAAAARKRSKKEVGSRNAECGKLRSGHRPFMAPNISFFHHSIQRLEVNFTYGIK